MRVSPSRIRATDETLRSTVGRDADVPRKRSVSDMAPKYIVALPALGNGVCHSRLVSKSDRESQPLVGKRAAHIDIEREHAKPFREKIIDTHSPREAHDD